MTRVAAAAALIAGGGLLWAADVLRELGVDETQAQQTVGSALRSGTVSVYPVRNVLKAASPAERARLVQEALAWAKTYTVSAAFTANWEKSRQEAAPGAPGPKAPVDEELKQKRAEQQQQIEEMKKNVALLPPDQRQAMEQAIAAITAQGNDPQIQQIQRQAIEATRAEEQRAYEEATKRWKESHPPDARALIARRLHSFLDKCEDVDFDARLVESNGKMRFIEPRFEQKSPEWKLCFRAGNEAVTAARTFATAWLAELEKK